MEKVAITCQTWTLLSFSAAVAALPERQCFSSILLLTRWLIKMMLMTAMMMTAMAKIMMSLFCLNTTLSTRV